MPSSSYTVLILCVRNYINLFWKVTEAFSCLVGINDTVLLVTVLSVFNYKKILFSNSYAYGCWSVDLLCAIYAWRTNKICSLKKSSFLTLRTFTHTIQKLIIVGQIYFFANQLNAFMIQRFDCNFLLLLSEHL